MFTSNLIESCKHQISRVYSRILSKYGSTRSQVRDRIISHTVGYLADRVFDRLKVHDATHLAAGVAYYALLSLFPLILGLLAILGIFLPSEDLQKDLTKFFEENLPGLSDALEENIDEIIRLRGPLGILSLAGLFWTASAMFGAIARAVNRAWNIHDDRKFFIRKFREILMATGVSVLFLVSIGTSTFAQMLTKTDLPETSIVTAGISAIMSIFINFSIFLLMYKYIPNTKTLWRDIWPGAFLATILFALSQKLFIIYLDRYMDYSIIYGSIGSIIALLVWIYISALILILGAEFSSEYSVYRKLKGS